MSKTNLFRDIVSTMMEAVTMDDNNELQVLDEAKMAEADEMLNQMVVETARDMWAQLESSEDALANMSDQISFAELNADPSHVASPALDIGGDDMEGAETLESVLSGDDFDLDSIFEMNRMEDQDEDFGPTDGDEEFDDMMTGNDEAGLGADDDFGDDLNGGDMDSIGGDMDSIGGDMDGDEFGDEEDEFSFDFLDDTEDGDEFGAEDGMGGDEFGAEDGMGGDEFGDEDEIFDSFHESEDEGDVTESDEDEDEDKDGDDD